MLMMPRTLHAYEGKSRNAHEVSTRAGEDADEMAAMLALCGMRWD